MGVFIDHYIFLGLPSGEKGFKLSEKEITKAYKSKALELHPDKRRDDQNALSNFQQLQISYNILKNKETRKPFDDLLRVKQQKFQSQTKQDPKKKRMRSDLEESERNASNTKAKSEEEIARILKEEISRWREMWFNKSGESSRKKAKTGQEKSSVMDTGTGMGMEKMLKVSWKKGGLGYSEEKLRGLFETFGEVKGVMISKKKKRSALVTMATKEAAVAASGSVCGELCIRLLGNEKVVGVGHEEFEDLVLQKLAKAHERNKER